MSEPILTAREALAWNDSTAAHWRKFLAADPGILTLPCSIARTSTVGQLLQHVVAVELRYAERILSLPQTDYANIAYDTVDAIYATHDRALALYREALASNVNWDETMTFTTRSAGTMQGTFKTIFFHAIFHGIRHYAQLATLLRENGHSFSFPGDYLLMGARPL